MQAWVTEFLLTSAILQYTEFVLRLVLKEAMTRETVERRQFVDGTALSGRHQLHRLHQPVQDQTSANHLVKYAHQK